MSGAFAHVLYGRDFDLFNDGDWYIFGAFRSQEKAEGFAKKLKKDGHIDESRTVFQYLVTDLVEEDD